MAQFRNTEPKCVKKELWSRSRLRFNLFVVSVAINLVAIVMIHRNFMLDNNIDVLPQLSFDEDVESSATSEQAQSSDRSDFYKDEVNIGYISRKDPLSFFGAFREEVDSMNDDARCKRYGFKLKSEDPVYQRKKPRRIFFGSLVASEPWELFEIIAAESYGIYEGIVLVESNRTQMFNLRNLTHYHHKQKHEDMIGKLFGIHKNKAQIRLFVNESSKLIGLTREHVQRNDILKGWKELGMQPDDVAILSDLDEVLTRDFLRAIQVCDVIDEIDYHSHKCEPKKMGLQAVTHIYEASPECITEKRMWFHPAVYSGHCLEGIGDLIHKPPPREGRGTRALGWNRETWNKTKPYTPSSNGGDFRLYGGVRNIHVRMAEHLNKWESKRQYSTHSAFHFHNWFPDGKNVRFKYRTYGHPYKNAYDIPLEDIHEDLDFMVRCAWNKPDPKASKYKRVRGGFENLDPFMPIYFRDAEYRRRRHKLLHEIIVYDLAMLKNKTE